MSREVKRAFIIHPTDVLSQYPARLWNSFVCACEWAQKWSPLATYLTEPHRRITIAKHLQTATPQKRRHQRTQDLAWTGDTQPTASVGRSASSSGSARGRMHAPSQKCTHSAGRITPSKAAACKNNRNQWGLVSSMRPIRVRRSVRQILHLK